MIRLSSMSFWAWTQKQRTSNISKLQRTILGFISSSAIERRERGQDTLCNPFTNRMRCEQFLLEIAWVVKCSDVHHSWKAPSRIAPRWALCHKTCNERNALFHRNIYRGGFVCVRSFRRFYKLVALLSLPFGFVFLFPGCEDSFACRYTEIRLEFFLRQLKRLCVLLHSKDNWKRTNASAHTWSLKLHASIHMQSEKKTWKWKPIRCSFASWWRQSESTEKCSRNHYHIKCHILSLPQLVSFVGSEAKLVKGIVNGSDFLFPLDSGNICCLTLVIFIFNGSWISSRYCAVGFSFRCVFHFQTKFAASFFLLQSIRRHPASCI